MLILYNVLQIFLILLLFPVICGYVALQAKYRKQISSRLGLGLKTQIQSLPEKRTTIWIHALSVGEVTSALPLVVAIREEFSDSLIIFSAATRSGFVLSKKIISPYCDRVIAFPLDLLPICRYFIRLINPNLFILVETDFWPNIIRQLNIRSIPMVLVNGRISEKSMSLYKRYSFFFKPLFRSFFRVCAQTEVDRKKFIELGVKETHVFNLGNLKYEPIPPPHLAVAEKLLANCHETIFIAGSTHPGEESILLDAYLELREKFSFKIIIAPRDIQRKDEIRSLAESRGLSVQLRSSDQPFTTDLLILDTIGELVAFYNQGDICYVGGSLVNSGGHNPLEPAGQRKPVIFGSDMSDFSEISADLVAAGAGFSVDDHNQLTAVLSHLLGNPEICRQCGEAAFNCIQEKQGILQKHIGLIKEIF